MQKTIITLVLAGLSLGAAADAFAQARGFGLSQKLGDADLYPAVRVEYLSDSNIFLDAVDETEASDVRVTPEILIQANKGQISLEAGYKGEYNNSDFSAANYADHALRFNANAELSSRLRAGASLRFLFEHQDIGTSYTRGIADENTDAVEFNQTGVSIFSNYGAAQARGNIAFGLAVDNLDFTNQAALTDGESYSSVEPYGIFSLRVSPDLRALAELRLGSTSYDNSFKDRTNATILLGVDIAPTGKLNGQIKIGSTETSYDNNGLQDSSELAIRTRLNYAPVDYSVFTLVINRETDKLSDNAATNDAASATGLFQLNWRHDWSGRLFHRASVSRETTNRDCPSDDVINNSVGYELNLQFSRWLELGVGGSTGNRETESCDATAPDTDYDRTQVGVHLRATL